MMVLYLSLFNLEQLCLHCVLKGSLVSVEGRILLFLSHCCLSNCSLLFVGAVVVLHPSHVTSTLLSIALTEHLLTTTQQYRRHLILFPLYVLLS